MNRNDIYHEWHPKKIDCEDWEHATWARKDRHIHWTHHIAFELAPCSYCEHVCSSSCKKNHRLFTVNYNGYLLYQYRIGLAIALKTGGKNLARRLRFFLTPSL